MTVVLDHDANPRGLVREGGEEGRAQALLQLSEDCG